MDRPLLFRFHVSSRFTRGARGFYRCSPYPDLFPEHRLGFAQSPAGSPTLTSRIVFVSYDLVVHLLLLSTPPLDDAVTFGFGIEHPGLDFH